MTCWSSILNQTSILTAQYWTSILNLTKELNTGPLQYWTSILDLTKHLISCRRVRYPVCLQASISARSPASHKLLPNGKWHRCAAELNFGVCVCVCVCVCMCVCLCRSWPEPYIWLFPCQKYRIYRVGQNHICMVYIRYCWQGNYKIYGHIRCLYTVLANPMYIWHIGCIIYMINASFT